MKSADIPAKNSLLLLLLPGWQQANEGWCWLDWKTMKVSPPESVHALCNVCRVQVRIIAAICCCCCGVAAAAAAVAAFSPCSLCIARIAWKSGNSATLEGEKSTFPGRGVKELRLHGRSTRTMTAATTRRQLLNCRYSKERERERKWRICRQRALIGH